MTLIDIRNYYYKILFDYYNRSEIDYYFKILIKSFFNWESTMVALNPNKKLSKLQLNKLIKSSKDLKKSYPIQYITGESFFMGLKFIVNKNVLIPRQETEELVEWIINDNLNSRKKLQVIDIGTGSGCIAIALAKFIKNSRVTAWDIDEKILSVAEKNASKNKVKVLFELKDITTIKSNNKFDLIISNPPYICDSEKLGMQNNVLLFEPHLALFVNDNDPLFFYLKIIDFAKSNLNDNGKIFLEINENQSIGVIKLLNNAGFYDIELKKDFRLKNRMIKASFK